MEPPEQSGIDALLGLIGPRDAADADGRRELARAVAVASVAHARQVDKSGAAYVLHPLRVMQRCAGHGPEAQVVGALHDVVEDTWVTLEHLRKLDFVEAVIAAVDAITKRDGQETYFDYIRRCARNRTAALVKLADLADNSDPLRRPGVADFESLLRRYGKAREIIEASLAEQATRSPSSAMRNE